SIDSRVRLLEANARGHRNRMRLSKTHAQQSTKDHDSLVMRRSRHPRFAFNINYAGLSERDGRSHARRTSEAVTTDVEHRESVDLSDPRALDLDDQSAVGDKPANFLFDKVK